MRERAQAYLDDPTLVRNIIADGCEKASKLAGETMRELISAYRKAWKQAGHPGEGRVMIAFHMYCSPSAAEARATCEEGINDYLRAFADAGAQWNVVAEVDFFAVACGMVANRMGVTIVDPFTAAQAPAGRCERRAVPEGAGVRGDEAVVERPAGRDGRLGQPQYSVRAIGQTDAVPMDRGGLGRVVEQPDADLFAADQP